LFCIGAPLLPFVFFCLEFLHRALNELLCVLELLEDESDVHFGLTGDSLAAAVDPVLPHQGQRVRQQIERHGEAAARCPHHRLVVFERITMLVED
jgi:hypothetical protein